MTYLLIGLSFVLAIIGTFTKTIESSDEEILSNGRKVTTWGYLVAILLLASAVASGVNTYVSAKEQKQKDEENRQALSQQRLLALASLGSAFTMAAPPYIGISFMHNIDMEKRPQDYEAFCEKHKDFPGFGIPVKGYLLLLEPTEDRKFEYASSKLSDSERVDESFGKLKYDMEMTPADVNHTWVIPGYRTLDEILFDFKSNSVIGTLTIWRADEKFSADEVAKLKKTLSKESGYLHIRVFLGKKGVNLRRVHVDIPVQAADAVQDDKKVSFTLTAGDPTMDSISFTPF